MLRGMRESGVMVALGFILAVAGGCDAVLGDRCEDIPGEAQSLVEKHQVCGDGDSCAVFAMGDLAGPNNCLGAFQCHQALRADLAQDTFKAAAQSLVDENRRCSMCVSAGCMSADQVTACCDVDAGRCVLDSGQGVCASPGDSR